MSPLSCVRRPSRHGRNGRLERTQGRPGRWGTYWWGDGRYTLYGESSADTQLSGFGDSYSVGGTAGFRMRF